MASLRDQFASCLRRAMLEKDSLTAATMRLILAALKDRDIAARGKGRNDGIEETEILLMLDTMIKQRRESIALYEQGGREDLAAAENAEIEVIRRFMPEPLTEKEVDEAIAAVIAEQQVSDLKGMGRVMSALRERYAGRMDFVHVSARVRALLS